MATSSGADSAVSERVIELGRLGSGAASDSLVRAATAAGLVVVATGQNRFRLARTFRPTWAIVVAIVTSMCVGLGLLLLLVKRTECADATVIDDRSGVRIRIVGNLSASTLDRLAAGISSADASSQGNSGSTAYDVQRAGAPASVVAPPGVPSLGVPVVESPSVVYQASAPVAPAAVVPPVRSSTVMLALPDGRRLHAAGAAVVGRNPRPDLGGPGAAVMPIDDPSLSKSHFSFGSTGGGVWVVDLHSTNGTSVQVGGVVARCEPGRRVEVPLGATVTAGGVAMTVVAE